MARIETNSGLGRLLISALSLLIFLEGVSASYIASQSFESCEEEFVLHPGGKERSHCFHKVALRTGQWIEAAERLDAHLQEAPDNWLRLYLAKASMNLGTEWQQRTESLLQAAIEGFAVAGNVHGEIDARTSYRHFLERRSRHREAREQAAEIRRLSSSLTSLEAQLRARLLAIRNVHDQKTNLSHVLRQYRQVQFDLEDAELTESKLYLDTLVWQGAAAQTLGQLYLAERLFQEASVLADKRRNLTAGATIGFNLLLTQLSLHDRFPTEERRAQILKLAQNTLKLAQRSSNRETEISTLLELGKLLAYPEGIGYLEDCVRLAREDNDAVLHSDCQAALALTLSPVEPENALTYLESALQLALETGEPLTIAGIYSSGLVVSWEALDPANAMKTSLAALERIEVLRHMQPDAQGRLSLFAEWVPYYQRLVGHLLRSYQDQGNREFLEQAFQVSERMRSRVLQEALTLAAHEKKFPIPAPLQENLTLIQTDMNRVNRHLLEDELSFQKREQFAQDLERLELQWAEKQHEILTLQRGSLLAPETPDQSLHQVQEALRPHEALLSFQVAPDQDIYRTFFGGSWVLAVTRDEVIVQDLGDGTFLPKKIEFLLGLLENRDPGLEGQALESLYTGLMEKAVQRLPKEVTRLILVPDGALHSLPFTALRIGSNSNLGERFQVTRSPSATLWLRWRNQPVESSPFPALVLTDPELETTATEGVVTAETRGAPPGLVHRSRLGSLPLARKEGRDVLRHLGRGTQLREGAAATEALVRSLDLTRYQILHFAAHAKADAENPERSAIYLARSSEDRDGLLQFREIVDLNLDGRIVVLSACDTATGEILRGEGVLDLARAFFQGGAHAVVASLWPLRDDDGRDFFDAFYRHLAEGESLAGALQGAQIDRIEAGAPAAAWAGIVVLGDGSMVPFPNAKARLPFVTVVLLAFGLFLVAAVIASLLAKGRAP